MSIFSEKRHKISADLQEELLDQPLEVKGTLPNWLNGSLIRNGPVTVYVDGKPNAHWFDGLAMLHAFAFSQGRCRYTNKFLRTHAYHTFFERESLHYDGFAVDPCRSLFKRFFTWFLPGSEEVCLHNANINVAKLANQYVALTETPLPVQFDRETLDTLGVFDYRDELPKDRCWESAHPHHDLMRNETINYLIEYGRKSFYTLYRIADGSSTRQVIARIPTDRPAYMHSFAVTENYIILTEFPFVVKPLDLIFKNKPFIKNFTWHPELGTHFIVIDRHSGKELGRYKTKPFFAFHNVNAFEEKDQLHLDIVAYPDAGIIEGIADHFQMSFEELSDENRYPSCLERFHLSLKTGEVHSEKILTQSAELPRINQAYDGRPYRFSYLADLREPEDSDLRPLYKVDMRTKQVLQWSEEGCYPGEPVFVPAPNAREEDEGVVLVLMIDQSSQNSFLLILDGKSFKEVGRAVVTHRIPPGLHGQYFE